MTVFAHPDERIDRPTHSGRRDDSLDDVMSIMQRWRDGKMTEDEAMSELETIAKLRNSATANGIYLAILRGLLGPR